MDPVPAGDTVKFWGELPHACVCPGRKGTACGGGMLCLGSSTGRALTANFGVFFPFPPPWPGVHSLPALSPETPLAQAAAGNNSQEGEAREYIRCSCRPWGCLVGCGGGYSCAGPRQLGSPTAICRQAKPHKCGWPGQAWDPPQHQLPQWLWGWILPAEQAEPGAGQGNFPEPWGISQGLGGPLHSDAASSLVLGDLGSPLSPCTMGLYWGEGGCR